MRRLAVLLTAAAVVGAAAPVPADVPPPTDLLPDDPVGIVTTAPNRETEPIVLKGSAFGNYAVPADVTFHPGSADGARCLVASEGGETPVTPQETCTHNTYEDPWVSSGAVSPVEGFPVDRIVGLAYDAEAAEFRQIPLQVDEMFVRYLSNNNSGFAAYSETDQHLSYAFDREGFRFRDGHPDDACLAIADSELATDPVVGLDHDDEVVFMYSDAGDRADQPLSGALFVSYFGFEIRDPADPTAEPRYVYVGMATEDAFPENRPQFDASNGYVRYERDADADVYLFSESSYDNYGAAPHGPYWDPETGTCVGEDDPELWKQRRPGDAATITTPRYRFRYDGRWLMTELQVSEDDDWTYGADLIDQWKARAFQQRPGGQTPCCGYEEEVNNWGGSSQLMGERVGPVRVIRETWGADSGTNVVRREIFYRDEIRWNMFLRVHVIPPLDGIYVQMDYNAGAVDTYYNPNTMQGVPIDGRDDEVFGNARMHVGPDGVSYDDGFFGEPIVIGDPDDEQCKKDYDDACTYNDVDTTDPWFSGTNGNLHWEQIAGHNGTLVTRWSLTKVTPGSAQAVTAIPYYRDDACFDDGTGSSPGPHLRSRGTDEGQFATWRERNEYGEEFGDPMARECWDAERHATDPAYARYLTDNPRRFWQGSIGTHGMHILLIADSDNAHTTLPITEIDSEQRMVVLPPTLDNVGERYGRGFEKPLRVDVFRHL